MAYVSQEMKASKAPAIKAICKKYGVKATLAVRHHSCLVLNIKSGKIDFVKQYNLAGEKHPRDFGSGTSFIPVQNGNIQVNPYWYQQHFSGNAVDFLKEVLDAMNVGNHDNSEPQTDYFDVGWYVDVNIGQWDKPYQYIA
jgi:hypothetical protein